MNETILTWLIFILAFGGMVLIHEFGHFIVARLSNIEVEEFGIGLPTPGAITFWTNKGFLLLRSGQRIEIPFNYRLPVNLNDLVDLQAKIRVDEVNERLILRSLEVVRSEEGGKYATRYGEANDPYRNQKGQMELIDTITEVHPGTRFTLNWLPLGGFVRPKGENDPTIPGGLAAASPWKRLAVLLAGPMMNLLTAVLIYSIIFTRVGVPDTNRVLISSLTAEGPAAQAGFQDGDILIMGNGQPIHNYEELRAIVDANENKPVVFLVDRSGQQVELTVIPRMNEKEKRVMIGVGLGVPFRSANSWTETLNLGARYAYLNVRTLLSLPAQMLRGTLAPEQSRLVGLKGIYDILEQTVSHDVQASTSAPPSANPVDQPIRTLDLIASLSISLGVFNLFPFPALDGGRILFLLPELIFRRRVPHRLENLVHGMGMALLLLFMIYVNVMDFVNPVNIAIP